jgi:hypothetical protein
LFPDVPALVAIGSIPDRRQKDVIGVSNAAAAGIHVQLAIGHPFQSIARAAQEFICSSGIACRHAPETVQQMDRV